MKTKVLKQYGIKCTHCKSEIYSNHGYDFKYCQCGKIFIDGGYDYMRYGYSSEEDFEYCDRLVELPEERVDKIENYRKRRKGIEDGN